MPDMTRWLSDLGLEKYLPAFAAAEVDAAALPHLTDEDLREIGLPLGPRRKLLAAIATGNLPAPDRPAPAAPATPVLPDAERRQLTVMFVDLVDSTEIGGGLDPEEMAALLRSYQNIVTGEILRLGGHVAKLMGDGVMAYFGWPVAHEDAAERAVRAGLALAAAVGRLSAPDGRPLAARVGIATGMVVVGELIGSAEAQERAVVGETPNLAARLQALAPPGGVVVAQGTYRLLGRLFDLVALPPQQLKGIAGAQQSWRVTGESRVEGRFAAFHGERGGEMIGRDRELDLLLERWQRARAGEGQVVVLSGEPGIGKSRIALELLKASAIVASYRLRYYCSPQHTGTPFWPIIGQLSNAAKLRGEEPVSDRLAKLSRLLLPGSVDGVETRRLFADLLSIPSGLDAALDLTPEEKKARTIRALVDQLAALSQRRPVLMLLEDAHWIDPSTREAIDAFVERIAHLPVLCVVTCRPEFQSPWSGLPHVTTLTLNRLGRLQVERIVESIAGGRDLPRRLRDAILSKTEGVPLFVEELTKMILESDLLPSGSDPADSPDALISLAIPDTLRDSLMARLDRFATAREIAQVGSVLGREFDFDLLVAVSGTDRDTALAGLEQLIGAELVFRRGTPPAQTFIFKHALVQDTAYQSLLKSRRQLLHGRTAEALRRSFADRVAVAPELLAHHLTEAGLLHEAVEAWLEASQSGFRKSAYQEVIEQLRRGLAVSAQLPDSIQKNRGEMRLYSALGQALQTSRGPVDEVEASYSRARRLADEAGEEREWVRASYGLWFCRNWRMQHHAAWQDAGILLQRTARSDDSLLILQAHHAAWTTAWQRGDPREAVKHAEIGHRLYSPDKHHHFTAIESSHDAGVCCCNTLGIAYTMMGELDRGVALGAEGDALTRQIAHPFSRALSLFFRTKVHMLRGEIDITVTIARDLSDICGQLGIGVYGEVSRIVSGWCAAASGQDVAGGIRDIRAALGELQRVGARARRTEYLGLLAERLIACGEHAEARLAVAEAYALADETGERFFLAELSRLDAAILLADDAAAGDEAERRLLTALDVASNQGTRLFELRAACDLAQLWADRGERARGCDLLSPVYDWFTQGLETPQLRTARQLRDSLA